MCDKINVIKKLFFNYVSFYNQNIKRSEQKIQRAIPIWNKLIEHNNSTNKNKGKL